jgi:MrcB-like, N-terminal domain
VRLRKLIGEIGAKYDRLLPMSGEAHRLLRKAEAEFEQWLPPGYVVESSGGKGKPAITPRIAIFNPDETTTARHGIYVAYLFTTDKKTVTLTLNQGIGEMAEHLGRVTARLVLALEATAIRAALRPKDIADLDTTFDLHTTAASSLDYKHANIVSRTYSLDGLPRESKMVADLRRFFRLYTLAIEAREVARRHGRQELIAPPLHPSAKIAAKTVPRAEAKPAAKIAPQPEAKPAAKIAPQPETKPAATKAPQPQAKPATKKAAESTLTKKPASPDAEKRLPAPDTSTKEPPPEIRVDRKHKTSTRSMTRRGVLAALVSVPIVYVTPALAASRNHGAVAQISRPAAETTPVFTIDVSQHDWARRGGNLDWVGIRHAGIAGMCARATYGDPSGYNWPTYHFGDFARAAKKAGMGIRGGYHNLVRGDQQSINRQVDWLRQELDRHDANWAMLDVEHYAELVGAGMWPRWEDVRRFDDRWAEVETRVLVAYIPPWNWSKHLGQPDLREFRGPLIASNYPLESANVDFKQLYEQVGGNNGPGWAAYGSRIPEGWQYSARAKVPGAPYICDVNAWRISFEQLKGLLVDRRQGVQRATRQPDSMRSGSR